MSRSAQELLDSLAYPPNHQYQIKGLVPEPALAQRLSLLHEVAPGFFRTGRRLLDVGCNKGFFSMLVGRDRCGVAGVPDRITEAVG